MVLRPGEHPTHRTAAGILVENSTVLLERRPADASVYPDCWDIPGGHVDDGEAPAAALTRELHEELGIHVAESFLAVVQDDRDAHSGRLYRHFVYVVSTYSGAVTAREGQTLRWWPLAGVLGHAELNPLAAEALTACVDRQWL